MEMVFLGLYSILSLVGIFMGLIGLMFLPDVLDWLLDFGSEEPVFEEQGRNEYEPLPEAHRPYVARILIPGLPSIWVVQEELDHYERLIMQGDDAARGWVIDELNEQEKYEVNTKNN